MLHELPLPPRGLWAHEALTTILSLASNGLIEVRGDTIRLHNPLVVSDTLKNVVVPEILRRPPAPLSGNDRRNIIWILTRNLCISSEPGTRSFLRDLGMAVARIISGEAMCPDALDPVMPLSILKIEYYEYTRRFGGRGPVSKRHGRAAMPALTQALALLGHAYTWFGRARAGDRSEDLHLNLVEKERVGSMNLYSAVHPVLYQYYTASHVQEYTSILQLMAAGSIAAKGISLAGLIDLDSMEIVGIGETGNRRSIISRDPLPIKSITLALSSLGDPAAYFRLYKSLVLSASGYRDSLKRMHGFTGRIEDARRTLAQVLASYSEYLVLYIYTRNNDFLYLAVRELYRASRIFSGKQVYLCLNPPCPGLKGETWIPVGEALSTLAYMTKELVYNEIETLGWHA